MFVVVYVPKKEDANGSGINEPIDANSSGINDPVDANGTRINDSQAPINGNK